MPRDPAAYSVDVDDPVGVLDLQPALVALLKVIELRQHSVMSEWGGPARCYSEVIKATGVTSTVLTVSIPPGVTHVDIAALLAGTGTLTITTSVDATGTQFACDNNAGAPTTDAEFASWFQTGGYLPTSAGAASGRAVQVVSTPSWTWQDVDLTIATSAVTSSLTLLAIEIQPLHVPR